MYLSQLTGLKKKRTNRSNENKNYLSFLVVSFSLYSWRNNNWMKVAIIFLNEPKKEHTKRLFNSFLNYLCLIWFQSFCNLRYINSNDLFCFITIIMLFFREPSLTCTPLISLETLEWVTHRAAGYTAIIILLFFSMTLLH